jgi:Pyruvate/2-oxoacid:ferredoxin oxidoreductase gamma subunit
MAAIGDLHLEREDFRTVISKTMASEKAETNLSAYDTGVQMIQ